VETTFTKGTAIFFVASPRLSDKKRDRRRAGSEREEENPLFFFRPPAFSIIHTDRESRTGYSPSGSYKEEDKKGRAFRNFVVHNLVPKF